MMWTWQRILKHSDQVHSLIRNFLKQSINVEFGLVIISFQKHFRQRREPYLNKESQH